MNLEMSTLWSVFVERAYEPWYLAVDKLMVSVFLVTKTLSIN